MLSPQATCMQLPGLMQTRCWPFLGRALSAPSRMVKPSAPLMHGQALCTPHAWTSPLHPSRMVNPSAPSRMVKPSAPSCMVKPSAPLMHGQALCTPHAWSTPLHLLCMVNPTQAFEAWQVWDSNPLYALLQETIYTQGELSLRCCG